MRSDSNIDLGLLPIGEWPFRIVAIGIDFIPLVILRFLFGYLYHHHVMEQEFTFLRYFTMVLLFVAVDWGYLLGNFMYLVGRNGQPLGMRAVGLKIVRPDGSAVSYLRALGRFILFVITSWTIIGLLWALWDEKCQTFHDKGADTIVIQAPSPLRFIQNFRKFERQRQLINSLP